MIWQFYFVALLLWGLKVAWAETGGAAVVNLAKPHGMAVWHWSARAAATALEAL